MSRSTHSVDWIARMDMIWGWEGPRGNLGRMVGAGAVTVHETPVYHISAALAEWLELEQMKARRSQNTQCWDCLSGDG